MSVKMYSFTLSISLLSGPVLALAVSTPVPGELALVIAPPWISTDAVIRDAGGRPIGPASRKFGAFALSDEPAFAKALLSKGAWFVIDGRAAAILCGVPT